MPQNLSILFISLMIISLTHVNPMNGGLFSNDTESLFKAVKSGDEGRVIKYLGKKGIDVNHRDWCDWTLLHYAARKGHLKVVQLLLDHKAAVNTKNNREWTPLHYAAQNGHLEVARLLLDHKAEVYAESRRGYTPLGVAKDEGYTEMVRLLENATSSRRQEEQMQEAAKQTIKRPGDVTYQLYTAILDGHLEEAENLLINPKIEFNRSNGPNGETVLYAAASRGYLGIVNELLQKQGIKINKYNNEGLTPFMIAAKNGHDDIVDVLFHSDNTILNTHNDNDETALSLAVASGQKRIVEMLIKIKDIEFTYGYGSQKKAVLDLANECKQWGIAHLIEDYLVNAEWENTCNETYHNPVLQTISDNNL